MVAQHSTALSGDERDALAARIRELRSAVPVERRATTARGVARRGLGAAAVSLLAQDEARVAAPVLMAAELQPGEWVSLIPALPPSSRALLRGRRDLPTEAVAMLASYGTSDFALPRALVGQPPPLTASPAPIPIREMVERIEAFQRQRAAMPPPAIPLAAEVSQNFRFDTDRDGIVVWLHGVAREALIGISLAELAQPGSFGVDGHAAGAFRQRAAFVDARLLVAGNGEAAGQWLISADPLFNAEDGRFLGYRGIGRRPQKAEPLAQEKATFGNLPTDSIRQLVHELRTPLNAIRGFAEMISGQLLGPVSHPYRERAEEIVADATLLAGILDDLETAARIERGDFAPSGSERVHIAGVLPLVAEVIAGLANERGVHVRVSAQAGVGDAALSPEICQRLLERLLGNIVSIAGRDEVVSARLTARPGAIFFTVSRPARLTGHSVDQLFDTAVDVGDEAGGLGFGFAMRLIESLARAAGAKLQADSQSLALILPVAGDTLGRTRESSEYL